mmetsp:Transcript_804/g.2917  ORF Transcript_804/g.2917 Transcript_804/m.2917 type:complete len:488 (+) Transcript_804:115-1578(+)
MSKLDLKSLSPRGGNSNAESFYAFDGNTLVGNFPKTKDHYASMQPPAMHRELLNDNEYAQWSNLTFIVRGERVHSFRAIVEVRCPELLMVVQVIKKKKEKKNGHLSIEFKDDSYMTKFTLLQILDWAYTGTLSFTELSMPDIQVVLYAAEKLGVDHLAWLCENQLRQQLTRDSAFAILKQADNIGLESIKEVALGYCKENWIQILQNKGGSGSEVLGLALFQELTIAVQVGGEKPLVIPEQKAEPFNTLTKDFASILETEAFADAEIVVEGKTIRFHKAIVAAFTKALHKHIHGQKGKVVAFPGLNAIAVQNMLQFIYFQQKKFNPTGASTLMEHGLQQYELSSMAPHVIGALKSGVSVETCLPILRITHLPICQDFLTDDALRAKALRCVCENFPRVDVPAIKLLEPSNQELNFKIMTEVLEALHQFSRGALEANAAPKKAKRTSSKKKLSAKDDISLDLKQEKPEGKGPRSARVASKGSEKRKHK